ncbi:sigma-70 family RNA polymerase sigma factor [Pelagibius sp. 7325]|uniref:sigma-70 family RNA polymerase sigma factor n=1 Tax=Pelagibius sp. 7325 TaxID=3131994 RepID=UPI0030ED521B
MGQNATTLSLFMAHRNALVDYASVIVGNRAQAEDLVQEAWLRFDAASQNRSLEEPQGYLYSIVRNLALDGYRRAARERKVVSTRQFEEDARNAADARADPETIALHRDELEQVMAALDELPERTRIALEMHRFGGCKLREIADFLGISLAMAHVLVAKGVEHCKRRLGRR